jgi:molybdopterin/thiamine biosynthesis adenylyltransferase
MAEINPEIDIRSHPLRVTAATIMALIADYDFVIDATDNFDTKFLINDACVLAGKPYSHGGVLRFDGQTMTVLPHASPCYRCIFPEPPSEELRLPCSRDGILGVLPGIIGVIQATEAIKYLLKTGDLLTGRLLTYNALRMKFRETAIRRNPRCPVCGEHPVITSASDIT